MHIAEDADTKFRKISKASVAIRTATEFVAVLFQLVCLSRLGTRDYYYLVNKTDAYNNVLEPSLAANLVLFVTLVVFQFPFMNAHILFMYDTCVIARVTWRRAGLCLWLAAVQLAGVVVAWVVVRFAGPEWDAALTWVSLEAPAAADRGYFGAEVVEELVAVAVFLAGYVHLTYLNFYAHGIFTSPEHLFSEFSEGTKKQAIPLPFILQMTLLVAGMLRAFPTAHLSPHISLYLALMRYTTWTAFGARMLGGVLGLGAAYALFWLGFNKRTRVHPESRAGEHARGAYALMRETSGKKRIADTQPLPVVDQRSDLVPQNNAVISFHNAYRHVYAI
jgi:hypothetical protein